MPREYQITLDGTLDLPVLSRDVVYRITYNYEPGCGPVWPRGEPAPTSPADPPEVDVTRIEAASHQVSVVKSSAGKVLSTEARRLTDWQDVTEMMNALLLADDWIELNAEIAERHEEEARAA